MELTHRYFGEREQMKGMGDIKVSDKAPHNQKVALIFHPFQWNFTILRTFLLSFVDPIRILGLVN